MEFFEADGGGGGPYYVYLGGPMPRKWPVSVGNWWKTSENDTFGQWPQSVGHGRPTVTTA